MSCDKPHFKNFQVNSRVIGANLGAITGRSRTSLEAGSTSDATPGTNYKESADEVATPKVNVKIE